MKKKIKFIGAFLLVLLLIVTACNSSSLAEYKKASEKTEEMIKGQTAGEFTLITEINPQGLTAEEIRELNYIKDMEGSFSVVFDNEEGKAIIRNYLNFGGLGYDFEVYVNGQEISLKLPVVGKYLKINEEMLAEGREYSKNQIISEETKKEFIKRWLNLMNEEDVFKGKNMVLTTPDGEVKSTEYTIKLKDEQVKTLLKDAAQILSRDESLKSFFDKNIRVNMGKTEEELKTKTFEEVLDHILKSTEEFKVDNFTYKASVDIDGYIVNEIIDISLKTIDAEKEGITGIRYHLDIKTWDINKDQKFEFPALTDENTLKPEEMKENMPSGIEDYFKIEI